MGAVSVSFLSVLQRKHFKIINILFYSFKFHLLLLSFLVIIEIDGLHYVCAPRFLFAFIR